jgi:CAAX protease family protein
MSLVNTPSRLTRGQSWLDIVLMLALVLVSTLVVGDVTGLLLQDLRLPAVLVAQGTLVLLVLRSMLWYRGEKWRDVGLLEPRAADFGRAVLALLACFSANVLFTSTVFVLDGEDLAQHLSTLRHVADELQAGVSYVGLVAMMLFVGVYEELAARGFLLRRCRSAMGGAWGPILVSSLLFGLGHVYQGWVGVVQTTLIGLILAGFTLRWGTLWPAILAHAGLNTISLTIIKTLSHELS